MVSDVTRPTLHVAYALLLSELPVAMIGKVLLHKLRSCIYVLLGLGDVADTDCTMEQLIQEHVGTVRENQLRKLGRTNELEHVDDVVRIVKRPKKEELQADRDIKAMLSVTHAVKSKLDFSIAPLVCDMLQT